MTFTTLTTMRHPLRPLLLAAALICATPALAQQSPIEQRMTPAEFNAAGLDKLSPEELSRLNAWLEAPTPARTRVESVGAKRQLPARRTADLNKSRVMGTVQAWDVGTVFALENGEKWEVVAGKVRLYKALEHPEVTLVPSLMGGWFLKFNADSEVAKPKVERVE